MHLDEKQFAFSVKQSGITEPLNYNNHEKCPSSLVARMCRL